MPAPSFHDIAIRWVSDTGGRFFRTNELEHLDDALVKYDGSPTPLNLLALGDALDAWVKLKSAATGQFQSHRNPQLVADLRRRVNSALLQNEPETWNANYPHILIARDLYRGFKWVPASFRGDVTTALGEIAAQPVGRDMLTDMSEACGRQGHVVIIEYGSTGSCAIPMNNVSPAERQKIQVRDAAGPDPVALNGNPDIRLQRIEGRRFEFQRGRGSSAVVAFMNDGDPPPDDAARPLYIALAHELVHAYHYVLGACTRAPIGMIGQGVNDNGRMEEEMRTVGFGKFEYEVPSENAIREEHHLGRRASYVPDNPWPLLHEALPHVPRTPSPLKSLPVRPAAPPVAPRAPALAH